MPSRQEEKRPHLVLEGTASARPFTAHAGGDSKYVPQRPRAQHAQFLRQQLAALAPVAHATASTQREVGLERGLGLPIQFVGQPEVELAFENLANVPKHIELLSVHPSDNGLVANVFVPAGKLSHFE